MIMIEFFFIMAFVLIIGTLYIMYNSLTEKINEDSKRINKIFADFDDSLSSLENKKDNKHKCCKSDSESCNRYTWKIEDRLKMLEQKAFTREGQNENGNRVISVSVPNLEDVP